MPHSLSKLSTSSLMLLLSCHVLLFLRFASGTYQSSSARALNGTSVSPCEEGFRDNDVLVLGDSWASFGGKWLQRMLKDICPSVKVAYDHIPGLLALHMIEKFGTCTPGDPLRKMTDVRLIWLSIGGNEVLQRCEHEHLAKASNLTEVISMALNTTESIISRILDASPEVQIVMHGYDFLGFMNSTAKAAKCYERQLACIDPEKQELESAESIKKMMSLLHDGFSGLSARYDRVHWLDWMGTFIPLVEAHMADSPEASPDDLMYDCAHPSSEGFSGMFHEFKTSWKGFLEQFVEGCAAVDPSPSPADEADPMKKPPKATASSAMPSASRTSALFCLAFRLCYAFMR